MKILFILFFVLNSLIYSQQKTLRGKVVDAESSSPLPNANISVSADEIIGTASDENGQFILEGEVENSDTITVSFVGYATKRITINEFLRLSTTSDADGNNYHLIKLNKKAIPSQTILVEATIGKKGITPLAFDQIKAKEIENNYTLYDIPKYLSDLPSTTFYSESGNGIGYNYVSIRGFDQRRRRSGDFISRRLCQSPTLE